MFQRILLAGIFFGLVCQLNTAVDAQKLKLENLFPSDRVVEISITTDEEDWESIRYVLRDLRSELAPERQSGPMTGPYKYIKADVTIDGKTFKNVGLRKKGLLGSQSVTRPSFKIKLDYKKKKQNIDGYSLLTLNNNQQDPGNLSQFMGYRFYQNAGLPAPRSALAHVTFNGKNFGVYTHVESAKKPLVAQFFGNSEGTLYEGTVNDFHLGWEESFDRKFGNEEHGREHLKSVIDALQLAKKNNSDDFDLLEALEDLVDLDHFYQFWAVESLLGFWDGYCGNRNNFFVYVNPDNNKLYFMPWGGDCMFQKTSRVDRSPDLPLSVKTKGMLAHYLYQDKRSRDRYKETLMRLLSEQWNEDELLEETTRIQAMSAPYLSDSQRDGSNVNAVRRFIRNRRDDIMNEISEGMPEWDRDPGPPAVITEDSDWGRAPKKPEGPEDIWTAAKNGNEVRLQELLQQGNSVDQPNRDGTTPLIMSALSGQTETAKWLLNNGADVNAKAKDGNTAIHSAAFLGHVDLVRVLVNHDVDLLCLNQSGETPVQVASGNWDRAVGLTMRLNGMLGLDLDFRQSKKNRDQVAGFLEPLTREQRRRDIWMASKDGKYRMVIELLKGGMSVDERNSAGATPLIMAAMGGRSEIAKWLIENGADINAKADDGNTPIHSAAFLGHLRLVKILVENGVDLTALNPQKQTPLEVAAFPWEDASGYTRRLNSTLDLGIDLQQSERNRKKVVEFLKTLEADSDGT